MIVGVTLPTFTFLHVCIGLAEMGSGLVLGLLTGRRLNRWTLFFSRSAAA
jgi:hypothetical protein